MSEPAQPGDKTVATAGNRSRYQLGPVLGAGGMAEVYRAEQLGAEGFARLVALKKMAPSLSSNPEFAAMFVAEARMAARLTHPNIVTVLDFDRDDQGVLFIAMEFVDGADLNRLAAAAAKDGQRMPAGLVAFAAGEVLRALDYAHQLKDGAKPLGLVHRDVSPHNVLVSRTGTVKLADFGISKATAASTATGSVKGKVAYMSPEQANGERLDGRSDLFAVGIMMYELLAGQRPFGGQTYAEILAQILVGKMVPLKERLPDVNPELAAIVNKLLERDRDKRYATAGEAFRAIVQSSVYPNDGTSETASFVQSLLDTGRVPDTARHAIGTVVAAKRANRIGMALAAIIILGAGATITRAFVKKSHASAPAVDAGPAPVAIVPEKPISTQPLVKPAETQVVMDAAVPAQVIESVPDAGTPVAVKPVKPDAKTDTKHASSTSTHGHPTIGAHPPQANTPTPTPATAVTTSAPPAKPPVAPVSSQSDDPLSTPQ